MNPYSQSVFSMTAECLPCCDGCFLTVPTAPIDGTNDPFADETEAQDGLDERAVDCWVWRNELTAGQTSSGATASVTGSELSFAETLTSPNADAGDNTLCKLVATAAGTISIPYSIAGTADAGDPVNFVASAEAQLYDSGETLIDSDSEEIEEELNLSGTLQLSVPAAGEYFVLFASGVGGDPAETTEMTLALEYDVSLSGATFCTIRAAYDDGGDTAYLVCA